MTPIVLPASIKTVVKFLTMMKINLSHCSDAGSRDMISLRKWGVGVFGHQTTLPPEWLQCMKRLERLKL